MRVIKWEPFRDVDDMFERVFADTMRRWSRTSNDERRVYDWAPGGRRQRDRQRVPHQGRVAGSPQGRPRRRGCRNGGQDRGDKSRRHRAVRQPAGDLRPAGDHVRGRFHRLAADELPDVPTAGCRRARARSSSRALRWAVPELREDVVPGDMALGVRPEHIPLRRRLEAARLGLWRRVSRHRADRGGRDDGWHHQGTGPGRGFESAWARRSVLALNGTRLSLFERGIRPRDPAPASMNGASHG